MTDTEAPELVVDARPAPGDASDGQGTAMAPALLTALASAALAKFIAPWAGLAAAGAAVVLFVTLRRPREGRFVLRVDGASLLVGRERGRRTPERIALEDLLDVTLERRTRQPSTRGGAAVERVRLSLERRAPADPIFIPDEGVTPLEGQEWLSKVRVFLRKHGWVPEDERG